MNIENLKNLSQFTGTESYYPYLDGINLTDGAKYLADNADCYWLFDAIWSYQYRLDVSFQIWKLSVNLKEKRGILTFQTDSNMPYDIIQPIPRTDFPLADIKLYLVDGVLMLPSEY